MSFARPRGAWYSIAFRNKDYSASTSGTAPAGLLPQNHMRPPAGAFS